MLKIGKVLNNSDPKERERVLCQIIGSDNDGVWCNNGWSKDGEDGWIPEIGTLLYIDFLDEEEQLGVYIGKVKYNIL